jgi:hypothetical protein
MKRYFTIITLALISFNVHAELNKWVDADGKVHYSDTRPSETTETQTVRNISGKDPSGAPTSYSPKSYAEREAEMKKNKQGKEDAAQKKAQEDAQAETRNKNCVTARDNARTLQESPRVVTYNEKGEKTYMDDSTRAQRLEEARKTISESCN